MSDTTEACIFCTESSPQLSANAVDFNCSAVLIPENSLSAWAATHQLADHLLHLDDQARGLVIDQIRQRKVEHLTQSEANPTLLGFIKDTFTLPPLNTSLLHDKAHMKQENEKMILALAGTTSPLNIGAKILRTGELPGFGKLISEAGMNSDVYAFGENQVVKFVRYGADAAKLLADSINKLASDPRLNGFVLPVHMLEEGGAHLLQERIPIHRYITADQQAKFDELVVTAREILDIPNHGADKSIYVGNFRLLIDTQPTNITEKMQWFDPVYMSIKQER